MHPVLSVQSRVAAGHVGNSAAVFCLERMGIDVWGVDTLSFSNHPGHRKFKGEIRSPAQVKEILDGIDDCFGLHNASSFLSWYLGCSETGIVVLEALEKARRLNPDLLYCFDPVMGDKGRVYVAKDIPQTMRERLVAQADIITPNHFELELLSQSRITGFEEAVGAARRLMDSGRLKQVLVTGMETADEISVLSISGQDVFCVSTPKADFSKPLFGTGDILTAIFLGKYLQLKNTEKSLSFAVSVLYGMIKAAQVSGESAPALIAAQRELETPSERFECRRLF